MHREGVANELHLEVTDELMSCEDEKGRRTVGQHDRGRRRRLLEKERRRDRQRGRRKALEMRNRDQRGRIVRVLSTRVLSREC